MPLYAPAGNVTGQASSVDSEITLFSGTTGKTIKRAANTGILKASSGVIATATAGTDYLSGNQNISLTGDVTGGPAATSIATTIGANKVTLGMMATLAADSIIGNTSASTATPVALTSLPWADTGDVTRAVDGKVTTLANIPLTTTINGVAGTRGDVLYYGASGWAKLAAGTSGNQLTTNGAGADPTWAAAGSGGSGSPAGSDKYVQFNDGGVFGGSANFTFDKATNIAATGYFDAYGHRTSSMVRMYDGPDTINIANSGQVGWSSTNNWTGGTDTALARNAAGVVEVNNGTAGSYRDLKLRTLTLSGGTTINVSAPSAANGYFLKDDGSWAAAGGGSGDVVGPAGGVVDNQVVLFNSTTGKLIKGATGTGIAKHTSGVLSLITAPTGALVGDTDTQTLTNKEIAPRVVSVASSATWSPNADTTDVFTITTAQAAAVTTINNPSGTPIDGQKMIFRVKCDGTARALTWTAGTQYRASSDMGLPTTLIASKTTYLGFAYNSTDTKWDLLAKMENF